MSEYSSKPHLSRTPTPKPQDHHALEGEDWDKKFSSLFDLPADSRRSRNNSLITTTSRHPISENRDMKVSKNKVLQENTYVMENVTPFPSEQITKVMDEMLYQTLKGMKYDPEKCPRLSISLANDIKQKVKEFDIKRYKVVTEVTIGQKKDQEVRMGSRCVWNTETDAVATAMYENYHIYAIALAFGLLYE